MPKIVDHDARREEIVDAVWRVISRDGIANATTRNIAAEAGCSNGVLSHYFADKGELLNAALLRGYHRVEERANECLTRMRGVAAIREIMILTTSITDEGRLGNQIELAFWGYAVGNPALAGQHRVIWERFRAIVRRLLIDARRRGEISTDRDVGTIADGIIAVVDGLGMEAALFPEACTAERQRAVIESVLASLGAKTRAAAARGRSAGRRSRSREPLKMNERGMGLERRRTS